MNAIISGRARAAIVSDNGKLLLIPADAPNRPAAISQIDIRDILGEASDLEFEPDTEIAEVSRLLQKATRHVDALDMLLFSLDPDLPREVRQEAISALGDLLPDDEVRRHLESVMYAKPLPKAADLGGARTLAESMAPQSVLTWLKALGECQNRIRMVRWAWDALPPGFFANEQEASNCHYLAVQRGAFRAMVLQETLARDILKAKVMDDADGEWSIPGEKILDAWRLKLRELESAGESASPGSPVVEETAPLLGGKPAFWDLLEGSTSRSVSVLADAIKD